MSTSFCLVGVVKTKVLKLVSRTFGCLGYSTNFVLGRPRTQLLLARIVPIPSKSRFLPFAPRGCGLAFLVTLCFLVLSWLGCFVFDHTWTWDCPRITVPPKSNRILSFNQECGIPWDTPLLVNLHVYVVAFILGQGGHPLR